MKWIGGFGVFLSGLVLCGQGVAGTASAAPCEASIAALRACYERPPAQWPSPTIDAGVEYQELGLIPDVPAPAGPKEEKQRALGEQLFFEPKLSGSGQLACVSCHHPDQGFADGRKVSLGHDLQSGTRNSPSLLNTGLRQSWFWDGRAASLAEQAVAPIVNPVEMASSAEIVEERLNADADYIVRFAEAFGDGPITLERVGAALAAYEETLRSRSSPFERFLKGQRGALSDQAVQGLHLFRTKARCANCHMGPLLSDERFHNIGFTYYGRKYEDLGRYVVTGKPEDVGRFRTPSLRDVAWTAPYLHNGLVPKLRGMLQVYNGGAARSSGSPEQEKDPLFPQTSPLLKPLMLTADEMDALESFLLSLSSRTPSRRSVSTSGH
ncbi:cytochrome-c peroxidase [Spongiibacter tropicus]|uniref:cytochrome-c peroxidase n=1 Tax=Spongiibacter tropicus TaxID=454602 RepID=UPI0035BE279F